jgi:uncharacterized protein (TIGR00730 family)
MKIGITLTSSLHVGQEYIDLTRVVVKSIAEKGHSIVYGGTSYGMMLELAETYKKSEGKELIGVMAKDLIAVTKGYTAYEKLDEKHLVDTMGERIAKITQLSDSLLILPGGYGTIEEMASMVGGKVNKLYDKPIAMYNYNGFYDTAISFFNELQQKEFTKIKFEDVVFVSENIDDILNYFTNYQPAKIADKFV